MKVTVKKYKNGKTYTIQLKMFKMIFSQNFRYMGTKVYSKGNTHTDITHTHARACQHTHTHTLTRSHAHTQ